MILFQKAGLLLFFILFSVTGLIARQPQQPGHHNEISNAALRPVASAYNKIQSIDEHLTQKPVATAQDEGIEGQKPYETLNTQQNHNQDVHASEENTGMMWKNKRCAVVLTYDDALNVHLDKVLPVLDSAKIKATFYVYGNSVVFQNRIDEWKSLALSGHELGNHSLFHPCNGNTKGNEWVKKEYDLQNYSLRRILDEIKLANTLLKSVDGKNSRTYAYPCGDKIVETINYKDTLHYILPAARGTTPGINRFSDIDLYDIKVFHVNENSGKELIKAVKNARKKNALIVFMFHGVGGEHGLNISVEEHNKLIEYLKKNRKTIWTAPLIDIVEYLKDNL